MSNNQLCSIIEEDLVLDVRSQFEFAIERIENSRNVPLEELIFRIAEIPQNRRIVLVCATGRRAYEAQSLLFDTGIEASVLKGGIVEWKNKGLPVEKGTVMPSIEGQTRFTNGFFMVACVYWAWQSGNEYALFLPFVLGILHMVSGIMDSSPVAKFLLKAGWNKKATCDWRETNPDEN